MRIRIKLMWLAALGTAMLACDSGNYAVATCSGNEIPANGCQLLDNDLQCGDACCAAAYSCTAGAWVLAHACSGYADGGSCHLDAGTGVTTIGPPDAGPCDAAIDAPAGSNGGSGCIDLEPPDCPLGEVLTCGGATCLESGCESLFYCRDGEWILWGACADDGGIVGAK